jgi:sialic acid synthase SpsE
VLTDADILIVRPESPIAAEEIDAVLGRLLKHPVAAFAPLSPADLEAPVAP